MFESEINPDTVLQCAREAVILAISTKNTQNREDKLLSTVEGVRFWTALLKAGCGVDEELGKFGPVILSFFTTSINDSGSLSSTLKTGLKSLFIRFFHLISVIGTSRVCVGLLPASESAASLFHGDLLAAIVD